MTKMWSNPNRDAVGIQSTSVAILVSALLAMSNLLVALLTHDSVFLILDGRVECTGTKEKKRRLEGIPRSPAAAAAAVEASAAAAGLLAAAAGLLALRRRRRSRGDDDS